MRRAFDYEDLYTTIAVLVFCAVLGFGVIVLTTPSMDENISCVDVKEITGLSCPAIKALKEIGNMQQVIKDSETMLKGE